MKTHPKRFLVGLKYGENGAFSSVFTVNDSHNVVVINFLGALAWHSGEDEGDGGENHHGH